MVLGFQGLGNNILIVNMLLKTLEETLNIEPANLPVAEQAEKKKHYNKPLAIRRWQQFRFEDLEQLVFWLCFLLFGSSL